MKRIGGCVILCACAAVLGVPLPLAKAEVAAHQHAAKAVYTCPMHPEYTSDRPGSCPICGMNLVLKSSDQTAAPTADTATAGVAIAPDAQQRIGVAKATVAVRRLVSDIPAQGTVTLGGTRLVLQVYENDMASVKPDQDVSFEAIAFPGKTFHGKVATYVSAVEPLSHTVNVAVQITTPTSQVQFRNGMAVYAHIAVDLGDQLAVPASAVMDTGARRIVYVVNGDHFTAREVTLGRRGGDFYEVVSGLTEGEEVATNGNFLIDAESKLKGAM